MGYRPRPVQQTDRAWIYAGLLIVAGVGVVSVLRRGPKLAASSRVLLVGDSLAVGLSAPIGALARDSKVPFEAIGQVGSTIQQWGGVATLNAALRGKLVAFKPTLVLVSLGTNDEYLSADAAAKEKPALEALVALIQQSGAELGWIGPPTLPRPTNGTVAMIQSVVRESAYFHSERFVIPRAGDQLHPTVKGYAGWAGSIWAWLK